MKPLMPPQISRILALAAAVVAAYFVARHFLVPASFGQYGWYRGEAFKDYDALPTVYAGAQACADCHADQGELKAKGGHQHIACESCHGALQAHALSPTDVTPPKIANPRFCVRCHEANPSRPERFPQVNLAKHYEDEKCAKCHLPHHPREAPPP